MTEQGPYRLLLICPACGTESRHALQMRSLQTELGSMIQAPIPAPMHVAEVVPVTCPNCAAVTLFDADRLANIASAESLAAPGPSGWTTVDLQRVAQAEDVGAWPGYPAKVRAALEVLAELCGGEEYCQVIREVHGPRSEGTAAIVAHVFSSDAFGGFDVEIGYDGSVKRRDRREVG